MNSLQRQIDIAGQKVLLVDDDKLTRMVVSKLLKRNDLEVCQASSGAEAIAKYAEFKPDIILLDIMMEGMDGFDTCQKIKEMDGAQEVPVVFLTTKSDGLSIVKGLNAGGADYIMKPFEPEEGIARMKSHLHLRLLMLQQKKYITALHEADENKNKIMSVVAHDLKNPISSIRTLSEFLKDKSLGDLNERQSEMIEAMYAAADSMIVLVEDLLDYSVLENQQIRLNLQWSDILKVVRDAVILYRTTAATKGIKVEFNTHDVPDRIVIDPTQIRRVIENIISNAIKFSSGDSRITLTLFSENEDTVITVSDEGQGIPEDEICKLFKPFARASVRPTAGEKSTGLGLSICKKIMEAHNGTIVVSNNASGVGCTFKVVISGKGQQQLQEETERVSLVI